MGFKRRPARHEPPPAIATDEPTRSKRLQQLFRPLRVRELHQVREATGEGPLHPRKRELVATLARLPPKKLAVVLARTVDRPTMELLFERAGETIPRGSRAVLAARLMEIVERPARGRKRWRPFDEASALAKRLGIRTSIRWHAWHRGELPGVPPPPPDVPVSPTSAYREQWNGWPDFLGKEWRSLAEARVLVRAQDFRSIAEWNAWCAAGNRPPDIPADPPTVYRDWKGWHDFFGPPYRGRPESWRSYAATKALARKEGLRSQQDWQTWCAAGKRPIDVPANPRRTYGSEWKGWQQFLGTPPTGGPTRWRPYRRARALARKQGLRSARDWRAWVAAGNRPDDIPARPDETYRDDWESWPEFLGTRRDET